VSQTENDAANSNPPGSEEQVRKIYAKDLAVGESIHTVFKAIRKERLSSRAGKPYLVIGLVDRTGEVDARVFDNVEAADGAFAPGDYLLIQGRVGHFHGRPQVIIERLERLDPAPIDATEFEYTAPPPAPTEKPAKGEKPERAEQPKGEDAGGHKAARQRLLRLLDNAQVAQALDVLVTYLERYIDGRIAAKLSGAPSNPDRKSRSPKVEHKSPAAESKPETPRRDVLPEGLTFKPFNQLVGSSKSTEGPSGG
jgi:3'-5' exoribonuclease